MTRKNQRKRSIWKKELLKNTKFTRSRDEDPKRWIFTLNYSYNRVPKFKVDIRLPNVYRERRDQERGLETWVYRLTVVLERRTYRVSVKFVLYRVWLGDYNWIV